MRSDVDLAIASIGHKLDLLLNLTPLNSAEAWEEFKKSGYKRVPAFRYRPLAFEPETLREEVRAFASEEANDGSFVQLIEAKARELEVQLDLLAARDTPDFLDISIRLYGGVSDPLLESAQKILANLQSPADDGERVDAKEMLRRAERELAAYKELCPAFDRTAELRPDIVDLMVAHGVLLIGERTRFRASRVESLIQHEVGTHIVTYFNGSQQPLRLMAPGLDGYEETQEGLAVIAEYATGGLDPLRMRIIAARVIAVKRVTEGAGFLDVFNELVETHDFTHRTAWSITARVARSGGLTKDAMYLRGLVGVLDHFAHNRELEPLLAGKIALVHVPLVGELIARGALKPPKIRPLWLDGKGEERLRSITPDWTVLDLLGVNA
jgi:uncharacterized protein (TIGR02421 family)